MGGASPRRVARSHDGSERSSVRARGKLCITCRSSMGRRSPLVRRPARAQIERMAVLVVALVPLFFGYCFILLIARYSPNVPRLEGNRATDGTDDRPEITPDEFADVVHELLRALG